MSAELVGKVMRHHTNEGYTDRARIVHQSRDGRYIWAISLNIEKCESSGLKEFYIKAPFRIETAEIEAQQHHHALSLVDFVPPTTWLLADHELENGTAASDLKRTVRRDLKNWFRQREEQKSWIEPIVKDLGVRELLECDCLRSAVRARANELGHKQVGKVARAMRLFLLGCGHPNALLPSWVLTPTEN